MAVYKEKDKSTWKVYYRFTDWRGERKQTTKRGFTTKREAQAWEREQLNMVRANLDMTFASFIDTYTVDMKNRIKENTWQTKEHIIQSKMLLLDTLKPSTISFPQFSITPLSSMDLKRIQQQRLEIWEKPQAQKCYSGRKTNIRNFPM